MRAAFADQNPVWVWFDFAVHVGQLRKSLSQTAMDKVVFRGNYVPVGSFHGQPLPLAG
jgi:hypothetical protein